MSQSYIEMLRQEVDRLSDLNTRTSDPRVEYALADASRRLGEALLSSGRPDTLQEAMMWLENAATEYSNAGAEDKEREVRQRVSAILNGLSGGRFQ
jgi:peptide subunit release factor 1 (eRF1)